MDSATGGDFFDGGMLYPGSDDTDGALYAGYNDETSGTLALYRWPRGTTQVGDAIDNDVGKTSSAVSASVCGSGYKLIDVLPLLANPGHPLSGGELEVFYNASNGKLHGRTSARCRVRQERTHVRSGW